MRLFIIVLLLLLACGGGQRQESTSCDAGTQDAGTRIVVHFRRCSGRFLVTPSGNNSGEFVHEARVFSDGSVEAQCSIYSSRGLVVGSAFYPDMGLERARYAECEVYFDPVDWGAGYWVFGSLQDGGSGGVGFRDDDPGTPALGGQMPCLQRP